MRKGELRVEVQPVGRRWASLYTLAHARALARALARARTQCPNRPIASVDPREEGETSNAQWKKARTLAHALTHDPNPSPSVAQT